ncbi:MAG: CoA-binding protein [Promethearchaeota archaeon]
MPNLKLLFAPKIVAIYEAKEKFQYFIEGFKAQGFNLKNLFLITPSHDHLFGIKCYPSFEEIPTDSIDLLILAIGRNRVVNELEQILKIKKVKFIHLFTAGLGEFDEKGIQIERKLKELIDFYEEVRVFGPNCMGVYSPAGKNAYLPDFPTESGKIGLIYQSGDLLTQTIRFGFIRHGLTFSKGISVGNCMDLQVSDFLEYFNDDPEVEIIGIYFEGFPKYRPREGKRFFHQLKKIKKPILFLRGGITIRAQTAVMSHTGTLSTDEKIWNAISRQTSLINVESSLDDMIDALDIFNNVFRKYPAMPLEEKVQFLPKGKNALIFLWSGGLGVLDTDTLTKLGLNLPLFKKETKDKLLKIYPLKVGSLSNPLDLPWITRSEVFFKLCEAAITEEIDVIIMHTNTFVLRDNERFKQYLENLKKLKEHIDSLNKILMLILFDSPEKEWIYYYNILKENGFLIYPNLKRAASAFLKLHEYVKRCDCFKKYKSNSC